MYLLNNFIVYSRHSKNEETLGHSFFQLEYNKACEFLAILRQQ